MFRILFILLVSTLFFGSLYLNQEQMLSLHFLWGMKTNALPLYLIVLGGFSIGFFISFLLFVPGWIRSMLDRRKKSKRIEELEIDIDKIRSEALKDAVPSLPQTTAESSPSDFL